MRALRKIAEETKNHDLERDLYIEERKAERGIYLHQLFEQLKKAPEELKKKLEDIDQQQREVWSNWRHQARSRNVHRLRIAVKRVWLFARLPWIVVMFFYWALAGYGRSFAWPALWLFVSVFIFHFGYALILAPLMPQAGTLDAAKYERAVCMLALGNAVPFVGPLTIDAEIKKISILPKQRGFMLAAHSAGMVSIPGDLPKPLFDHLRVFHRPRLAQLFQNQVTGHRRGVFLVHFLFRNVGAAVATEPRA